MLIWSPLLGCLTRGVIGINLVKVDRSDIIVINSVFNVFHIFMGSRHADFAELINQFVEWILPHILDILILAIENLSKVFLGFLAVDLSELLEFHLVLGHKVLLLLSQITEILSWRSGEDLAGWDCNSFLYNSTGRYNTEGFNAGTS